MKRVKAGVKSRYSVQAVYEILKEAEYIPKWSNFIKSLTPVDEETYEVKSLYDSFKMKWVCNDNEKKCTMISNLGQGENEVYFTVVSENGETWLYQDVPIFYEQMKESHIKSSIKSTLKNFLKLVNA